MSDQAITQSNQGPAFAVQGNNNSIGPVTISADAQPSDRQIKIAILRAKTEIKKIKATLVELAAEKNKNSDLISFFRLGVLVFTVTLVIEYLSKGFFEPKDSLYFTPLCIASILLCIVSSKLNKAKARTTAYKEKLEISLKAQKDLAALNIVNNLLRKSTGPGASKTPPPRRKTHLTSSRNANTKKSWLNGLCYASIATITAAFVLLTDPFWSPSCGTLIEFATSFFTEGTAVFPDNVPG